MKKKTVSLAKLNLNKNVIAKMTKSLDSVKGGATFVSCNPSDPCGTLQLEFCATAGAGCAPTNPRKCL